MPYCASTDRLEERKLPHPLEPGRTRHAAASRPTTAKSSRREVGESPRTRMPIAVRSSMPSGFSRPTGEDYPPLLPDRQRVAGAALVERRDDFFANL